MTDKKMFGSFIKTKRIEKNYSQKDLAEMLFVTEGAVSKWERGVSYPDITLISDICRVLDVSEHELITASTDTDARKMKQDARKFRVIRSTWFWVPTISYAIALLICFICNIAVNHTLSWFFVVLASLVCAYTFVPNVTMFFESQKFLAFCVSTYVSISILLFTCAVYTNSLFWFPTACIGTLMGYVFCFIPILLSKSRCSRYRFVISYVINCALTVVLLLYIDFLQQIMIVPSILIALYGFTPAIISAFICTFRFDNFLKCGICVALCTVFGYFSEYMVSILFGVTDNSYMVNFDDWVNFSDGNVMFISLISLLFISGILIAAGIFRVHKKGKVDKSCK